MMRAMEDGSSAMLRRLAGLLDPSLRTGMLTEHFSQLSVEGAVDLLGALVAGAEARSSPHRSALLHACQALHQPTFRDFRSALAQQAADRAQYALTQMFRVQPGSEQRAVQGRDLQPLGSRKAKARVARPAEIPQLLVDPDPAVVEILLDNPKMRLSDVLRIATRRPSNPAHLEAIFSHPRWLHHYAVQSALAKNPATPAPIAHCLLYQLRESDLKEITQAGRVEEPLRMSAQLLLHQPSADEH